MISRMEAMSSYESYLYYPVQQLYPRSVRVQDTIMLRPDTKTLLHFSSIDPNNTEIQTKVILAQALFTVYIQIFIIRYHNQVNDF